MLKENVEMVHTGNEKSAAPLPDGLSFDVLKKLFEIKTLDECVNYASTIMGNPVLIVDPAFGILTHSHYEVGWDKGWDDLFRRGEYTYEYLASNFEFDKNNISELERGVPAVGLNAQSENRRLVVRMYSKDILLGSFSAIEARRPFISTDLDLAHIFARTAGHIIAENRIVWRTRKYGSLYPLLIDRLDGIQNDENAFNDVLKNIGLQVDSIYRVVLVALSNYYVQKRPPDSLKDYLKTLTPNIQSLFYESNILVLLPLGRVKDHAALFAALDSTLSEWNLRAAVSDKFHSPFDLPEYYRQAKTTFTLINKADGEGGKFLQERKPYSSLLFYEDFRFMDIAMSVLSAAPDVYTSSLYDDKMIEILEYDQSFGTKNMNTLWVYLNNDKNILSTSLEMGIHRNTTNYRLRKIEELFDLDFTDQWQMFRIYSSYLIYLNTSQK